MRTGFVAATAILIIAALTASGCGTITGSADRADTAGADLRRDYRGDFGTFRYPGPPLTGGGN